MNIDRIITEEINRYITESTVRVINEDKKTDNKFQKQSEREKERDGNAINSEDEAEIRNMVDKSDLINVAALARKVFPDHTPEGAQSQLRKQLKGIKNDSGKEYHIKQRVGKEIRKQMQQL